MEKEPTFKVNSGYLLPGLELHGLMPNFTIHQIAIFSGMDGADGELQLDPNTCALDDFGTPVGCTEIAIHSIPVAVILLKESEGRRLFEVKPKILHAGPQLRLVLEPRDTGGELAAQLLVLADDETIQRIVSLKASP